MRLSMCMPKKGAQVIIPSPEVLVIPFSSVPIHVIIPHGVRPPPLGVPVCL